MERCGSRLSRRRFVAGAAGLGLLAGVGGCRSPINQRFGRRQLPASGTSVAL